MTSSLRKGVNARVHAVATDFALASPAVAWSAAAPTSVEAEVREWNFRVWLGDIPIGHHNFRLVGQDGERTLVTEADFRVRFLFVTAYRYQHFNTGTWQGGCLQKIEPLTDANCATS